MFIVASITCFHPEFSEEISFDNRGKTLVNPQDTFSILSWNIGYAGLGKEMDFFYKAGKKVRPSKEQSYNYLTGIMSFLQTKTEVDFVFLQEVDFRSRRSYKTNQFDSLQIILTESTGIKATNYKSGFVPVPVHNPMGTVNSGMVSFSTYLIKSATRYSTPKQHNWPYSMFMPKRCFLEMRFSLGKEKELVLINIHNSAFGDEKEFREAELKMLRKMIIDEFEAGNYVVAGGDWNQNPPGMDVKQIKRYISREVWPIQDNYLPGDWTWAYDPTLPTNRDVEKPFDFTRSTCTLLDYFVTSPNVKVIDVETVDLEFQYSDHQPVLLKFKLF
ncbi:MAG: endonuclease/exonuclease/phosphatase family protein [Bacteroidales bacterium]